MKTLVFIVAMLTGAAPRVFEKTSSSGTDHVPLNSASQGVGLDEASSIRVSVVAPTGTITGGKLCAFYYLQSVDGGTSQWVRNANLDITIPSTVLPDGGTVSAVVTPDLEVKGAYGRVAFVACGVTGTATNMTVRTESFDKGF